MRSKVPIPRSPRNFTPKPAPTPRWKRGAAMLWKLFSKSTVFAAVTLGTVLGNLLVQGPDAIRKAPEIPEAALSTLEKLRYDAEVNRKLTGVWEFRPTEAMLQEGANSVRLVLSSTTKGTEGEIYADGLKKVSLYRYALIEGQRSRSSLQLKVWDLVGGSRTVFAELEVKFTDLYDEGEIFESPPEVVNKVLDVKVLQQQAEILPRSFTVERIIP